jgi:hypothetical protein
MPDSDPSVLSIYCHVELNSWKTYQVQSCRLLGRRPTTCRRGRRGWRTTRARGPNSHPLHWSASSCVRLVVDPRSCCQAYATPMSTPGAARTQRLAPDCAMDSILLISGCLPRHSGPRGRWCCMHYSYRPNILLISPR